MPEPPDIVFSGINNGYNAGPDNQYSGTVGAALDAACCGYPAIAYSEGFLLDPRQGGYNRIVTDKYLAEVLEGLLGEGAGSDPDKTHVEPGVVVNVNFPDCPLAECRGILRGRKVSRGMFFRDSYRVLETFPDGGMRMEVDGAYNEDAEPETDFRAIVDHYVSVGTARNIT